jgi:4-hydroxy-tetrahydrodipicolinate synthase
MEPRPAYEYLKSIADRAPRPIWLYNNGMRGLQIPVPVVRDLKDHPNIAGIKAAGFDLMDIIPFCMMDGENFQTIGSGGSHILLFLAMGCEGHTVSTACCFPGQFCEIYALWMAGKTAEAREKSFALSRLSKSLPRTENTEMCAEAKAALELMGICKRHVYPPFLPVPDQDMPKAKAALTAAGIL